jgi:hypothetical protein
MNVTNSTLFPDLEGLARSSAYELEVVWERLIDEFVDRVKAQDEAPGEPDPG